MIRRRTKVGLQLNFCAPLPIVQFEQTLPVTGYSRKK